MLGKAPKKHHENVRKSTKEILQKCQGSNQRNTVKMARKHQRSTAKRSGKAPKKHCENVREAAKEVPRKCQKATKETPRK